jgi:AbrB family looped-hinge helix DNA binding protein
MQATVKISRQGQITIPKEIRLLMGIGDDDYVTIDVLGKPEKIGQRQGNSNEIPCQA